MTQCCFKYFKTDWDKRLGIWEINYKTNCRISSTINHTIRLRRSMLTKLYHAK